jgi:hypothetical protein
MKNARRRAFRLPLMAAFMTCKRAKDGKTVAHSLDFDLVTVADDEARAFQKLRLAVKTYIEYGLSNNWVEDIVFPAPRDYWEYFSAAKSIQSMEPIQIEDDRMIVVRATIADNEHRQISCPA